jgi:phosphate transport system protein
MPRETLDRAIHHLQDEVLLLGSMVEEAILAAMDALRRRDSDTAHLIYRNDQVVNDRRFAIENATLIVIATQQPMAHDLRFLAAILEILTEIERMGDYAKDIAKVVWGLGEDPFDIPIRELNLMAECAVDMLHRALVAFINSDHDLARKIAQEDDQVDELYNKVYRWILAAMIADPQKIDRMSLLLWVAHNLERTADRVTNICERTVFIATGEFMELDTNDEDENI